MCLEEKLSPLLLSALEEDSQMGRLFACRSMSTILKLIGTSLHPEALNKIYPGKLMLDFFALLPKQLILHNGKSSVHQT